MTSCLIQARMRSTRFPGKVLEPVGGIPILALIIARLRKARTLDHIAVITTTDEANDPIADLCAEINAECLRFDDDENDVLGRYAWAANADAIVRITADCPFVDWQIVDRVVNEHKAANGPLTSNVVQRTYPRGFDVECVSAEALRRLNEIAKLKRHREHVTLWWYEKRIPGVKSVLAPKELTRDYRICVDEPSDLELARRIADAIGPYPGAAQIVEWLDKHPEAVEINQGVRQRRA